MAYSPGMSEIPAEDQQKQQAALIAKCGLGPFGPITSRVAGPRTLRFAPVTDYSMFDTWRSLLYADCSVFHITRPVLLTDLTRHPTLSPLRRSRIAPCSTL